MRFVIFVVLWFLPAACLAQEEIRLQSAEVSWGDSAFTSGLDANILFSIKENRSLQIVGNHERFYTALNFSVGKKLSIDATGGSFKKLPWAGPRIKFFPIKQVMLLYWGGVSPGRIGALKTEAKSFFQQGSFYVTPEKHISLGYNWVKLDAFKATQIPEVAYYYQLKESVRLGFSAAYDTTNGKPLFCLLLRYSP